MPITAVRRPAAATPASIKCVTVVLPWVPVTPISVSHATAGRRPSPRPTRAPSAASGTTSIGRPESASSGAVGVGEDGDGAGVSSRLAIAGSVSPRPRQADVEIAALHRRRRRRQTGHVQRVRRGRRGREAVWRRLERGPGRGSAGTGGTACSIRLGDTGRGYATDAIDGHHSTGQRRAGAPGRRDAELLQGCRHQVVEDRTTGRATAVAVARLLDDDIDDEARVVGWREPSERRPCRPS